MYAGWYTDRGRSGVWPHTKPQLLCSQLVMSSPKLDSKESNTQIQDVLNYTSLFKLGVGRRQQENLKVRRKNLLFATDPNSKCDFFFLSLQKTTKLVSQIPTGLEFSLRTHSGARLVESGLFSEACFPSAFLGGGSSIFHPAANSQEQQALPYLHPLSPEERPETRPPSLPHCFSHPVPRALKSSRPQGIQVTIP